MKINRIAAATLVPAALAGVAFTSIPFAQAAPVTPAVHAAAHHVAKAKPQHRHAVHHAKAASSTTTARSTASTGGASTQRSAAQTGTAAAQPQQSATVTSDTFNPKAVSSFEACVAGREGGNTPT